MRIFCDSCGAKYSIADEKVAGKMFKIKCKRCSNYIVVRGDRAVSHADAPEPASGHGGGAGAIWHVVVEGEQQGPLSPARIGELLSLGTIDWEAYVWRDGFDEWMPAKDVEDLVTAVMGNEPENLAESASSAAETGGDLDAGALGPTAESGETAASVACADETPAGGEDGEGHVDAQSLLAVQRTPAQSAPRGPARRAPRDKSADLFAQPEDGGSPFDGDDRDEVISSAPGPRVTAEQAMTGARNENSVLFSLQNLQALATGSGGVVAPPQSQSEHPGHASGEGSGLIDIRALASAAAATSGSSRPPVGKAAVDELLTISSGASPFGPLLGAPTLGRSKSQSSRGLLLAVVAGACLVVVGSAGVVGYFVFVRPQDGQAVAAYRGISSPASESPLTHRARANASAEGAAGPAGGLVAVQPAVGTTQEATLSEPAAPTAAEAEGQPPASSGAPVRVDPPAAAGRQGTHASQPAQPRSAQGDRQPDVPPAGAPSGAEPQRAAGAATPGSKRPAAGSGGSDLDSLLDRALGGSGRGSTAPAKQQRAPEQASAPASSAASELPDTPPRDAVASALRSVQGAVSQCAGDQHGIATASITVAGAAGRVTNVAITGQFAGTPVGSCVARAVRGARFPRFRRESFQVSFPYRL